VNQSIFEKYGDIYYIFIADSPLYYFRVAEIAQGYRFKRETAWYSLTSLKIKDKKIIITFDVKIYTTFFAS